MFYLDGDNDKNLTTLVYFAAANYASVDSSEILVLRNHSFQKYLGLSVDQEVGGIFTVVFLLFLAPAEDFNPARPMSAIINP